MVTAVFDQSGNCRVIYGDRPEVKNLWQWDYGQVLRIQGLKLPSIVQIHFSLRKAGGESVTRLGITKDGVTEVPIPEFVLENQGTTIPYEFYAFVYLTDETSGRTAYKITINVKSRPKPEVPGGGEDPDIFHDAVQKVKESADKAAESERQAEGWAHGREDLPERARDNAKYYAGQTAEDAKKTGADRKEVERLVESVSGIDEQVTKVENLTKQAQTSATNAVLSAQAAKTAETNAQNAQAGAETAASKAAEDRTAVETAKTEVMRAKESINSDRAAVEAAKQEIDQLKDDIPTAVQNGVQKVNDARDIAIGEINKTGTAHKTAVESAGNTAVESVKTAQTSATKAVETAKAEAVEAVQTEGTTQTGNVSAEGQKQLTAVQQAAQEIIADRDQIQTNKEDIEELRQNKAGAIVETVSGEMVQIGDSSGAAFEGMSLLGKSEQVTTTGANLFDYRKAKELYVIDCTTGQEANYGNGWLCSDFIQVDENATYSINNQGEYSNAGIGFYDSDKNFINGIKSNSSGKFTTPSQISFVRVTFWIVESTAAECMLNKGEAILSFEPYTGGKPSPSLEYPQEIENSGDDGDIKCNVSGKNLFDVSKIEDTWNGTSGIINNNGVLTVTSPSNDSTIGSDKKLKELCSGLIEGKQYVLHAESTGNFKRIYLYNAKEAWVFGEAKTITKAHLESEVRFYANSSAGSTATIKNITVEHGSATTPYEPYRPLQSLTVPTPNGLPGIKVDYGGNYTDKDGQQWVCDEIDLERGKYVQRVGKYTFDGTEFTQDNWLPTIVMTMRNDGITGSNRYRNELLSNCGKINFSNMSGRTFGFDAPSWGISSGEELRTIMKNKYDSETPVLAQYPLATPIETDLPPETIEAYKQLRTNYPTTVITNDSEAGMEVSYVADTKHYITAKIETPLQKQITDLQNALINQKISGGGYKSN